MRPAWKPRVVAALGAATLLVLGAPALHGSARLQAAPAFPRGDAYLAAAVSGPSAMRLPAVGVGWHGGAVTAATGEQMTIYISDGYTPEQVSQQTWADFFAGLIHGSELTRLVAYVVTPTEVQQMCGLEALACAGGGRIVVPGEPQYGWAPTTVATHEYAHFIALNRSNPPWNADAFGTKRWASVAGVCARVGAGTAFPGDESEHYRLNPGEAFAEVYRVLNETRAGAFSFAWSIVDSSFYPDSQALSAAEQDVRSPWLAPTAVSVERAVPSQGRPRVEAHDRHSARRRPAGDVDHSAGRPLRVHPHDAGRQDQARKWALVGRPHEDPHDDRLRTAPARSPRRAARNARPLLRAGRGPVRAGQRLCAADHGRQSSSITSGRTSRRAGSGRASAGRPRPRARTPAGASGSGSGGRASRRAGRRRRGSRPSPWAGAAPRGRR